MEGKGCGSPRVRKEMAPSPPLPPSSVRRLRSTKVPFWLRAALPAPVSAPGHHAAQHARALALAAHELVHHAGQRLACSHTESAMSKGGLLGQLKALALVHPEVRTHAPPCSAIRVRPLARLPLLLASCSLPSTGSMGAP